VKLTRRRALIGGSLAVAVAAAAAALLLSLSSGTGPVAMLSYQGQLSIDGAGHAVQPGRQGYATAFVFNSAHGQAMLLSATLMPVHMAAGVKITYRWHGQDYTVIAWSARVACGDQQSWNRCTQLVNMAQNLTIAQAG
jgi:C4-dicarboxylate transporter